MKTLLPALLLIASVPAQPWLYSGPVERRTWHGPLATGQATGSTAGHFLGAGYPDVAILYQGVPHLYASPGALNCLMSQAIASAPTVCTALATMFMNRAPSGRRRDQLLVSNYAGLWAWGQSDTGAMVWTLLDASPLWSDLRKLVVADVNADGHEDLVAIAFDPTLVMVRLGTSSGLGSGSAYEFFTGFTPGALDLTTTAWDATPAREIAVATTAGLWILDYTLGTRTAVPGTAGTNALVASARRGTGELLVLSTSDSAGTWWLHSVDPVNPSSISLDARDLVACVVGDANLDGLDDLMFSHRMNHSGLMMLQLPGPSPFSLSAGLDVPLIDAWSTPAPNNSAVPVFADLDGDGDADLVHAVTSNQSMALARSIYGTGRTIGIVRAGGEGDLTEMSNGTREQVILGGERQDLQVLMGLTTNGAFPPGATHIEVAIWRLELSGQTITWQAAHSLQRVVKTAPTITLTFDSATEVDLISGGALYLQLRPIRVVTAGSETVIEYTYAPSGFLFAGDESEDQGPTNFDAVLGLEQALQSTALRLRHDFFGQEWQPDTNGGVGSGGPVGVEPPPPGGGPPPAGPG